jgi:hypothetical protein
MRAAAVKLFAEILKAGVTSQVWLSLLFQFRNRFNATNFRYGHACDKGEQGIGSNWRRSNVTHTAS